MHIVLGALLGVILVMRVVWRSRFGRRLSLANDGVWGHLARIAHWALYVGLAAAILLGMTNALVRGDSIFSLFRIPKIYPNIPQLKPSIEKFHQTAANALVILAAVHALAAVAHHYILRDGVLRRMLPRDHSK